MNVDAVRARLERLEGRVPHMYLDSTGHVTVGVGHLLRCAADACDLPFIDLTWAPATVVHIVGDFTAVSEAPRGLAAASYIRFTFLHLQEAVVDRLTDSDIAACSGQLARAVPEWISWPEPAQEALFDMAYNLGLSGLLKYHHMLAACRKADWRTAAAECFRHGIGQFRNDETAALFRLAS